jgi:hypothetical protein
MWAHFNLGPTQESISSPHFFALWNTKKNCIWKEEEEDYV